MSDQERAKISRRRYLKYASGIVAVAIVATVGYGIYETARPPVAPTPTATPTPMPTLSPTPTPTPTITPTPTPVPPPRPVDSKYGVLAYYLHGLGADPRLQFTYATVEPIYGKKQNLLTMMMDIKYARENGITTFVMPSSFPDTPWESRLTNMFLMANTPPFEIKYSLMFNPDPYLWGNKVPYPLETGVEKTIKEFFKQQFSDRRYKRVDDKPLVFFFFAQQIAYHTETNGGLDRLERVVDILRSSAGEDVFLVGDVMQEPEITRFDKRINDDPNYYERLIRPFDAITAYYLWRAGEGWYLKDGIPYVVKPFNTMISGYRLACEFYGTKAERYGAKLVPPISPTGVSNQLLFNAGLDNWLVNRHEGVTYDSSKEMAVVVLPYVDSHLKMVIVGAYNEITEGAAVVPSKQFGFNPIHAVRDVYAIKPENGWPADFYP